MLETRSKWAHHIFIRALKTSTVTPSAITQLSQVSEPEPLLQVVRTLCAQNQLHNALSLFYAHNKPPLSINSNSQTYATLLHACALHKSLSEGQALHHYFLSLSLKPNLFITNHLINLYAKCGCLDYAQKLFDEMPERNLISWTALISGYYQHNQPDKCFKLFSCMLSYLRPNEFAFASVLSACDRDRGRQVHALTLKTSFDAYVYVGNALITMYYKNDADDSDDGWLVFETMPFRNLITWNSMIAGVQLRNRGDRSLELFSKMQQIGVGFDRVTLLSVIASLCCFDYIGDNGIILGHQNCCQLHCLAIKTGFLWEVEVATALVKAYSKLGGVITDCYKLFSEINGSQDIVSWTGIITIFAERDPEEALFLFCEFRRECLDPDRYTFSSVIKACAGFATERHCSAIHALVIKYGFNGDLVLSNALIHAYARSGSITLSEQVFDRMEIRNSISWNSMLKANAVHGRGREALKLFTKMNTKPDSTTIVALLSACSHAGLVDEGIEIFETMFDNYGISPQCDHFACMVDILGRAGRICEAEALINTMPMKADSVVWSALLGACRKHGEAKMAEMASMKLMELEPKNSLGYIQMSNIYCLKGSFKDAALIRKEMKGCKVRKEPGLSWIEIGNRVHEFAAGGRRHPQKEAIYAELEGLVQRLKNVGYVPETSLSLHDMEEEHKEEQLYYHSEKLALAFALINTGSGSSICGSNVIRIMKNIRICVDCHNFMKLASDLVQREIVVRDANLKRFDSLDYSPILGGLSYLADGITIYITKDEDRSSNNVITTGRLDSFSVVMELQRTIKLVSGDMNSFGSRSVFFGALVPTTP
ncbi:Pentatricopeptide repeat [Macleaya cordata]|uniref:Pentatricopeptide repeat n=1 Tax=Macleaya cordata TaxID=56857 RepID=A0A200QAE3_MACCD|nr:Pentatricopeptide repeat [Macleaya cordata]